VRVEDNLHAAASTRLALGGDEKMRSDASSAEGLVDPEVLDAREPTPREAFDAGDEPAVAVVQET
jgi:hypothetical protein